MSYKTRDGKFAATLYKVNNGAILCFYRLPVAYNLKILKSAVYFHTNVMQIYDVLASKLKTLTSSDMGFK